MIKKTGFIILFIIPVLLSGCVTANNKIQPTPEPEPQTQQTLEQPSSTPSLHKSTKDISQAVTLEFYNEPLMKILPVIIQDIELDNDVDPNIPVSINVKNVSVKYALTYLLKPAGLTYTRKTRGILVKKQPIITFKAYNQPLNIVLNSMMSGFLYVIKDGAELYVNKSVNVDFKNVPLELALDRLLAPVQLFWLKDGDTYIIYRDKENLFYVDFPIIDQSFEITSSRAGNTLAGRSTTTSAGLSAVGSDFSGGGGISSALSTASASGKTSTSNNLIAAVEKLLTKDGVMSVHKEIGAIWIRDRADIVDRVGSFLDSINKKLKMRVKINGIITEVTLDEGYESGINWEGVVNEMGASGQNLNQPFSSNESVVAPGMMKLSLRWTNTVINTFITALREYGDLHVVSKPSLTIVNGAIGSLIAGSTISYVAQAYTSETSSQTSTSSLIVQPLQTGLSFYVLPRIISDEEAILYISPELTTLQEIRTITSGNATVEAPVLEMKQTQTIVNVKNGETLIFSGLMSESIKTVDRSVPILSSIPLLGEFFKYKKKVKKNSEFALMIEVKW